MDAVGEICCTVVLPAEIIKIDTRYKINGMPFHPDPFPQVNTQCHNKLAA